MKPSAQKTITAKSALSATGGFLQSFTHSLQPYTGCAFGHGCGVYCYVPFLPVHRYGSEGHAWGDYVWAKENVATVLREELQRFARRDELHTLRIFMSSATDPYQPAELKHRLTRACLEAFADYRPGLLVIQTRSPIVERDFDLIDDLSACAWLSMTLETDDDAVREALTPGVPRIARRKRVLEAAHTAGLQTQVTLSPFLKVSHPDAFGDWLARYAGRVIVDTFTSGDGSRGRRTARSRLPEQYEAADLGDWRNEADARAFYHLLQEKMGAERVGWSHNGFNGLRSVGGGRQLPLL